MVFMEVSAKNHKVKTMFLHPSIFVRVRVFGSTAFLCPTQVTTAAAKKISFAREDVLGRKRKMDDEKVGFGGNVVVQCAMRCIDL